MYTHTHYFLKSLVTFCIFWINLSSLEFGAHGFKTSSWVHQRAFASFRKCALVYEVSSFLCQLIYRFKNKLEQTIAANQTLVKKSTNWLFILKRAPPDQWMCVPITLTSVNSASGWMRQALVCSAALVRCFKSHCRLCRLCPLAVLPKLRMP